MSLIAYITRIHFADRVLEDGLAFELRKLGVTRPLIVTDRTAAAENLPDLLIDALPPSARAVGLCHAPSFPRTAWIIGELRTLTDARGDGVIGLGGVGALDAARVLGARARHGAGVPVVTVPTTTQSVGLGPIFGGFEPTIPDLILCDPTLALAASPLLTAAAGMDALTHCIEAYLGAAWNPPADGIAIDGARRAMAWLERAVKDGSDLDARREMLAAALNAGLAASKGLGGVHALSWAIEAESDRDLPHGLLHAALLPAVLTFNRPATVERHEVLSQILRLPSGAELATAIAELGARVGLPARLGPFALDRVALRRVAARAAEDRANLSNPRHATISDYHNLLEAVL